MGFRFRPVVLYEDEKEIVFISKLENQGNFLTVYRGVEIANTLCLEVLYSLRIPIFTTFTQ